MPFSQFQELALFHSQAGFYSGRAGAGRSADFITSVEVGQLFADVMAMAIDKWWRNLDRPNPFYVIEGGAGVGTLVANILAAKPRCAANLRYVTVEKSPSLRIEQLSRFSHQPSEEVLDTSLHLKGPLVTSLEDLPEGKFTGIVLANELLDNLPVDIYERIGKLWYQVCVGLGPDGFEEVLIDVENDELTSYLQELVPQSIGGSRMPLQQAASDWLKDALGLLDKGRVVVLDYARTTRWMSRHPWEDWMRTYRGHRPGVPPLEAPGTQDITCEVAVDQLVRVCKPDQDRTQAEFLDIHGLGELTAEARDAWHSGAVTGDLNAARARSRVQEARALTDPNGLGRFRVLEWKVR